MKRRLPPSILAVAVIGCLIAWVPDGPDVHPVKSAAIVVLAGSMKERTATAAALYKAGYAPLVLLTNDGVMKGWSREHQRNLGSVEVSKMMLIENGVNPRALVILPFKKSGTIHDAAAVRHYLVKKEIRSIILVTSDYHVRRSIWSFKQVLSGIDVRISAAAAPSQDYYSKSFMELIKLFYYIIRHSWMENLPD